MAVRIRLKRQGRKQRPYYHIVVADARSPRDGRFIERIGNYDPNTQPATIEINVDKAVNWLQNGAEATDTVRAILSYKGVLYKNHLLNGVRKGALTEEQAVAKFEAWLKEKESKISGHAKSITDSKASEKAARLEAERKVNQAREAALAQAEAEAQITEAPEVETPEVETPEVEVSEIEVPEVEASASEVSEETPQAAEVVEAEEETPNVDEASEESSAETPEA
ncbi:MAG: 30S ribosomal protein S16 [Bacteroidetes bacterium]|jgi:small subunit ribosomal protein S16|nr:30S ribosomal protein S16 [Bacteroidota bacterium]MDA0930663.1 30S ribosomal protein S16 [Bacteroidota bacterium]